MPNLQAPYDCPWRKVSISCQATLQSERPLGVQLACLRRYSASSICAQDPRGVIVGDSVCSRRRIAQARTLPVVLPAGPWQ